MAKTLTQIKNTQKASKYEIAAGFSESASWHARFKHSAYIFAGGLPYDLTEGDLLAIFAQYGELVDINLVKDKDTGRHVPAFAMPAGWQPLCEARRSCHACASQLCHASAGTSGAGLNSEG